MIRRIIVGALAGALCATLVVDTASAFTRREALCVKAARSRSKAAVLAARKAASDQLAADLRVCLNDGTGCVSTCIAEQSACQLRWTDKDPSTGQASAFSVCKDGCKAANVSDVDACRDAVDPVQCVADAQLKLFTCNQACAAAVQPYLIECNGQFNDCLQGCSNPQ